MSTAEQITAVRELIGDTDVPYTISDVIIGNAVDVAVEEIEDYNVSPTATARGRYATTLLAGHYVVSGQVTGNINERNVTAISEADAKLSFADLSKKGMEWKDEAMEIVHKLMDIPFDTSTFDDYRKAEIDQL